MEYCDLFDQRHRMQSADLDGMIAYAIIMQTPRISRECELPRKLRQASGKWNGDGSMTSRARFDSLTLNLSACSSINSDITTEPWIGEQLPLEIRDVVIHIQRVWFHLCHL